MTKRNSANLSMISKVNLYKTMILPIVTYASQCWYATSTSLRKLEALQKRVVEWITFDDDHRRGLISTNLSLYLQLLDLMILPKIIMVVVMLATFVSSLLLVSQTAFTSRA